MRNPLKLDKEEPADLDNNGHIDLMNSFMAESAAQIITVMTFKIVTF